ncbi:MAG TPA: leucine-rich repeat protein, partial [Ruminococcus sp.]
SIGNNAFSGCKNLASITIPNSVTSIGESAFAYCENLKSVTISNSVTSIDNNTFSDCTSLTSVTIPDSVTSIGNNAFSDCTSLTSVTIPDSVTSIGNNAFSGCKNLASITIANSVTSIGEHAFSKTSWLENKQKENPLVIVNGILIDGKTCSGNVTIPDSVTSIVSYTFYDCTSLTSITIPDSVTSIGESAFSNCKNLTSVTIPDSITSIGRYAFFGTSWLENKQKEDPLVIVSGILIDGETCSGNVTIPDSVTSIGEYAFSYCENLTSIIIPNSVTSIGESAFSSCTNLTSVTIPNSVISVGYQAFAGCSRLESVTLLNPECEIYDNNGDTICNSYDGDNETYTYSGVIKGYSGSTAEAYAKKYDRTFESLDEHQTSTTTTSSNPSATLIGDTNEDEEVNLADAVLIMQNLANPTKYKITEQGKINGDVDETGDGITPNDAFKIQQYVLGIIGTLTI